MNNKEFFETNGYLIIKNAIEKEIIDKYEYEWNKENLEKRNDRGLLEGWEGHSSYLQHDLIKDVLCHQSIQNVFIDIEKGVALHSSRTYGTSTEMPWHHDSVLPNEVAGPLAAMLARLLFQYKVYQTTEERKRDPVVLVCEEAHRYVPDRGEAEYAAAQTAIRRIAREGRKYGIGLMLVSQRPADVESTVISQCGTWLVLRLTNAADQQHVSRFLPDGLSGMTKVLPNLAQQEAIFVGEGASMPARVRIRDLTAEQLPKSETAKFAKGWTLDRLAEAEIAEIANRMAG